MLPGPKSLSLNLPLTSSSLRASRSWAGWGGGGTERVEIGKMDLSEILPFLAFGLVVLCVLACRHGY